MMAFIGFVGGLNVLVVLLATEAKLRDLEGRRKIDIVIRTIPGERPPVASPFDEFIGLWRMLQWLAIGVILLVACAALALKGS